MSKRRSGGCGGGNVLCSVTGGLVDESKAVLRSSVKVALPKKNQSKWVSVRALRDLGATQSAGLVFGDSHGSCTILGDSLDRPGGQSITIGDSTPMPKIRPVKDTSSRAIRVARPGEAWDAGQRPRPSVADQALVRLVDAYNAAGPSEGPQTVTLPSGRCVPYSQYRRVVKALLRSRGLRGRGQPPIIRHSGQVGPILEISGRRTSELK